MPTTTAAAVGISNLPNQRHKIVSRYGSNFTVLLVGESGTGKTTFINTLFSSLIRDYSQPDQRFSKQLDRTVNIDIVRALVEEKGFKLNLTVIDTPGFGDYINNTDCWVPVIDFVDEQHHNYMKLEEKSQRDDPEDLRVHVCLYFITPSGHTLKPLDIEVMKKLGQRCNLIPVIAKADTMTPSAIATFKNRIRDCISVHNIQVYSAPIHEEEDSAIMAALPFSVIGSEEEVTREDGTKVRGRQYLWGNVEVENDAHCDFNKLRNLLIRSHMHDLISSTEEVHYEHYRSGKLTAEGRSDDDPTSKAKKSLEHSMKNDEEALRKRFTEQVRLEETRFRKWEQRLISERDRLNKDLEANHKEVKALEDEVDDLIAKRNQK